MQSARATLVVIHRWSGLCIAGFLILAGLTGGLLAWNDRLDAWIYPALTVQAQTTALDPLTIREQVQARYPQLEFDSAPLHAPPGKAMVFNARPLAPIAGQPRAAADFDQVFVDPYTGKVQGTRMWGELSQGSRNLMPFVHRLHYSLLAGKAGTTVLGIVALIWTLNCFAGLVLTFPPRPHKQNTPRPWLLRWQAAWKIRWSGSSAQFSFDLHRATSLWLWTVFALMAWSAVSLSLPQVFNPVMHALLPHQDMAAPAARDPDQPPRLSWAQARSAGRKLMREQSAIHEFAVEYETSLHYDASRTAFRYVVRSDRDIRRHGGETQLWLDARDGALLALWLPTGRARADTFATWLKAFHQAAVWGAAWKVGLTLAGAFTAIASLAGLQIWARRRHARRQAASPR